jgi:hypothetical protein
MRIRVSLHTLIILAGATLLLLAVYDVVPGKFGIAGVGLELLGAVVALRTARREGLDPASFGGGCGGGG